MFTCCCLHPSQLNICDPFAPTESPILTIQNFIYTQIGQQTETWGGGRQKRGKENIADLLFGEEKKFFVRFDLKESREGFCRRGRGKSLHAEGPTTGGKVREATVITRKRSET